MPRWPPRSLETVRRYVDDGFVPLRERYNALLHARGEEVDIVDDGRVTARGRAVEVDTIGRLVLATESGLRAIIRRRCLAATGNAQT